jgi:hypothetical protein
MQNYTFISIKNAPSIVLIFGALSNLVKIERILKYKTSKKRI